VSDARSPSLDSSLRRAETLVAKSVAFAVSLDQIGPGIELPPSSGAAIDRAQLRAIAALYLASELDAAGVVAAAESLMRLARTGSLDIDIGEATPLVERFWLARNERATTAERQSFFGGLFGGASVAEAAGPIAANVEFEDRLIDLCEALYKLDEQASNASWGGVAQQARVRTAAGRLLDEMARHVGGMTAFFASEVLSTLKAALRIVTHADVRAAFRARDAQGVIAAIHRRVRMAAPGDLDLHARRGEAGMTILAWLADAADVLGGNERPLLGIDHPVIAAAVEWLEVSLTLTEAEAAESRTPQGSEDAHTTWAALAG
jgi:hypothetical protein